MSRTGGHILSRGADWNFDLLNEYNVVIGEIASEFTLDTYPNQIEIITSEQMLDAYASSGLPISYAHWSYGKGFLRNHEAYRRGMQGLAYEIVINSNPCIAYLMEENTMAMQALVIAHACYGHNSFFKGNYLFRQFTQADGVLDYLIFARNYIREMEERHGVDEVETILDACHSLSNHGVDPYIRPHTLSKKREEERTRMRLLIEESLADALMDKLAPRRRQEVGKRSERFPVAPEHNILYFIEKHAPGLQDWQKEIVRIVRKLAQYFYPQRHTKVMNEGWATFWHYTLLNEMYTRGFVDDGLMLEFLGSHTNVVLQRDFDSHGFSGINPYALGFQIFQDIRRICEAPTDEDRHWFPDIAGRDWQKVLSFVMRNFKDESFIGQYLSPRVIRNLHLFAIRDDEDDDMLQVSAIHNEDGYRHLRRIMAEQYAPEYLTPLVSVAEYKVRGDRSLRLIFECNRNRQLDAEETRKVLEHVRVLWGEFPILIEEVDPGTERVRSYMSVD